MMLDKHGIPLQVPELILYANTVLKLYGASAEHGGEPTCWKYGLATFVGVLMNVSSNHSVAGVRTHTKKR